MKYHIKRTREAFPFEATLEQIQSGLMTGDMHPDWSVRRETDGEYDWLTLQELCESEGLNTRTIKQCPYCGKEYPDDATVCAIDRNALRTVKKSLPQGKRCATSSPPQASTAPTAAAVRTADSGDHAPQLANSTSTAKEQPAANGHLDAEVRKALDLRLARGEVSPEEYARTLDLLMQGANMAAQAAPSGETKMEDTAVAASQQKQQALQSSPSQRKAGCGTWASLIFILCLVIGLISEIGGCDGSGTGAWKEGYDTGLAAGKIDGSSSRIIPTEDSVERYAHRCLLASEFANASAFDRDQWESGFMSGYRTGFKEVTKPAF